MKPSDLPPSDSSAHLEAKPHGSLPSSLADALRERIPWTPDMFGVLGSGLGHLGELLEDSLFIPFEELGGLPRPGAQGHAGRFIAGHLEGRRVLLQSGRFHLYEGHSLEVVAAPVRAAAALGTRRVLLTNAAGGINPRFEPGTIMLIDDHLNLMGRNPLIGPVRPGEERFPDMSEAYDPELKRLVVSAAGHLGLELSRGVYAGVLGPSYETPAEIRMLAALGADAVGMSTVPETLAARGAGLSVLGLSLITNLAAGIQPTPLSHEEVLAAGQEARPRMEALVRRVLAGLGS